MNALNIATRGYLNGAQCIATRGYICEAIIIGWRCTYYFILNLKRTFQVDVER